jgi:hypothetical protein
MAVTKKTPSLSDVLSKPEKEEEVKDTSGAVPVWQENPEHALGKLHPDFAPQKMSPDNVGYGDE